MKKELKAHPLSNAVTFMGIVVSFFLISYCMLFGERYRSQEEKQDEAFRLSCNIAVVEKDITVEQAKNVLKEYEELAQKYSLKYAGIENLAGEKVLVSGDIRQGMDTLSSEDADDVCQLINEGALCFVMRNGEALEDVYEKLAEICVNNGFEISVNTHKEISERQTAVMEQRLYILMKWGSMIFTALLLFLSIFLWFDKRKHEWFIRNICGQSVYELLAEAVKIILSFIIIAYIAAVLALSVYKPVSFINIAGYGFIGFVEAILCMILLCIKYSRIKR